MLLLIKIATGYIPQGLSFVLAIYAFCREKVVAKRFLISSAIMIFCLWLIRQLPITMGVNILPNMLVLIALSYGINRLPLIQTVIGCLSVTIFMLVVEFVSIVAFSLIYGSRVFAELNANEVFTAVTAIPPMMVFTAAIVVFYIIRTGKRKS